MNESTDMLPIENPDRKCDEVKYFIDLLTKEACKYKAVNATLMSRKLVSKIRESQRHNNKPMQESKDIAKNVKKFMKNQKKQRDQREAGGDDTQKSKRNQNRRQQNTQ